MEIMQLRTTETIRNKSRKQKKSSVVSKTSLDIEPKLLFVAKSFECNSNSEYSQTNKSVCNKGKIEIMPQKENERVKVSPLKRNERMDVSPRKLNTIFTPTNMRHNKFKKHHSFSSVVPNDSNPSLLSKKLNMELQSAVPQRSCDILIHTDRRGHISCSDTNIDKLRTFTKAFFTFAEELCSVINNNASNEEEITFTVSFDIKNVRKQHRTPQITSTKPRALERHNLVIVPRERELLAIKSDIRQFNAKNFPIKNEVRCGWCLNKSHLVCDDFLRTVAAIFSVTNCLYSCPTSKAPSLRHQHWHFQNIAQGYLLRILLKNTNVNTLNVMRNLYFVIITTDSPNLILETNFCVKNDIFMLQDINATNDLFPKRFEWENGNEIVINDRNTSTRTLSNVPSSNLHNILSDLLTFGSSASTVLDDESCHSLPGSASFTSSQSSRCTLMVGKRNATTSNILSVRDNVAQRSNPTIDIAVDCDSLINIQNNNGYKFRGLYCRPLFANVFHVPSTNTKNKLLKYEYIDETIFEQISLERYVHSMTDKCTAPEFYTVFLKCLGHTLGCTLVSFFISIL